MKQGILTSPKLEQALQAPLWQSRHEAGLELAHLLLKSQGPWHCAAPDAHSKAGRPLVLALPRGGVPVAAPMAAQLRLGLATWSVRKLTRPEDPEYALGALAAGPTVVWNDSEPWLLQLPSAERQAMIKAQQNELLRRQTTYGDPPTSELRGRSVIVVDDGVATGLTARAALKSLRRFGVESLTFVTPVTDKFIAHCLLNYCDQIVTLAVVSNLISVGRWYVDFPQLQDREVLELLKACRRLEEST